MPVHKLVPKRAATSLQLTFCLTPELLPKQSATNQTPAQDIPKACCNQSAQASGVANNTNNHVVEAMHYSLHHIIDTATLNFAVQTYIRKMSSNLTLYHE
eukprot:6175995-Pleurochrysis_carterae.AAC.1